MIRRADLTDAQDISNIYNHYISHTVITFEDAIVSAEEMSGRMNAVFQQRLPWLVALDNEQIIGYAYASPWHKRSAYRFSVEVSAYILPSAKSQGWGSKLFEMLFAELKENSVHAVIGGISLPNPSSVALHEKFGMQQVAHYKEVGFKFDRWVDVGYWQGILESQE